MKNIIVLNAVTLTAAQQSGGGLRSADLFGQAPLPENVAIELHLRTNGTAPGASKTVTVHYALASEAGLTATELSEANSSQVLNLPNAANTTKPYTLPILLVGQRYLYLWFDNDALTAGAELTITPKLTTQSP